MKLNVSEYRWILLNCNIMVGLYKGKQYAVIEPKFPKYQAKLDRLLGSITFPSIEEWNKISRELKPKLKESSRQRREQAIRKLAGLSNAKLSLLNNKQRIELLDGLLQDVLGRDVETFNQNKQTVAAYKDQLKILLFGIKLPEEFLAREQARCSQFCNRLQSVPRLKEDLENWFDLDFRPRRELAANILNAFNDAYQTQISLRFFTENEWRETHRENESASMAPKMPAAYSDGNILFIAKEKDMLCNNLSFPALIFHEAMKIARKQEDWSAFPLVDKLFENKFGYLALEGNDLYAMNPMEAHAYQMDEIVAAFLLEKMQIKFVENGCPPGLDTIPLQTENNFEILADKMPGTDD